MSAAQSDRDGSPEHKLRRPRNQEPAQAAVARPQVKLFDLRSHHCRWIVLGSGEGAVFCGKPRLGGSPYCLEHTQRAWQRLTPQSASSARRIHAARRR